MSLAFAAPALLAALLAPGPAPEARLAACAWERAAASSATLVGKARFDKLYRYDADGSPTVGPLMRIRAACADRTAKGVGDSPHAAAFEDDRKLLKLLKQTQPASAGPDLFDIPVIRCEYRFADSLPGARPSVIIWSYGEGGARKELSSSRETLGVTLGQEDMRAILSNKVDPSKLFASLDKVEPVQVATLAEGKASGKPFALAIERGLRTCQRVNSDGSYTDA